MNNQTKRWEILSKENKDIVSVLLKNRGIKSGKEFFNPVDPAKISLKSLGIKNLKLKKLLRESNRQRKAKKKLLFMGITMPMA